MVYGVDSWVYVEMFGRNKEEWFRSFLGLPDGIPSRDTLGKGFSHLNPEPFQRCFVEWNQAVAALLPSEVMTIEDKGVRPSHDKRTGRATHVVSAGPRPTCWPYGR